MVVMGGGSTGTPLHVRKKGSCYVHLKMGDEVWKVMKRLRNIPLLLSGLHLLHQQKISLYVSQYIAIYSNIILIKFEIQAAKYLRIQATSNLKIQSTTKNVKFTIPATVCKGCMHCRDYKSMYLSAITADYVFLRSLVIDCREYRCIYVVTKI